LRARLKGCHVQLKQLQRYTFLPPEKRAKLSWPGNARVAFWVVPNIEFYELDPGGSGTGWPRPVPDVLNYSLRDYGNRVGVWRIMDAMDKFGVRGSVSLNAAVCDRLPEIVDACVERSWELMSHGIYNTQSIHGMDEAQVDALIADSVRTISKHAGRPVRGFLAPAVSSTETYFDLLPKHGITYSIDLVQDDRPVPIITRDNARLISVPYSSEINDVRIMGFRNYSAEDYASMVKSCFDQLYEEGGESGTVLCVPLHPYVVGQPHRIGALLDILRHVTSRQDVWLATGEEIADRYYEHAYEADKAAAAKAISQS
jgi:allantoinase